MLRDQPLQPHQAGMPEQVRPDLALLEVARKMPSTRRASSRARLVLRIDSGSLRMILAVAHQHVEGVELHLVIVLARVQAVEVAAAVDAEQHGLAVDHERVLRLRSAASVISG